ncbi:hypothetical protein I7I50_06589 [Histoplasma capsulatum G186AR]|uniref:Uncharacterized protein n=1 Tax=Ajellomyces capsulatus TaxID=5037 RepID=A0A8H7Z290_AJECA|nr:hypothetical protein I7I52_10339 [Histoplasma capsulatum]QSS67491.1 hypothetical protein I7I50_06589 [Histoplasma capsulatum G186AR]
MKGIIVANKTYICFEIPLKSKVTLYVLAGKHIKIFNDIFSIGLQPLLLDFSPLKIWKLMKAETMHNALYGSMQPTDRLTITIIPNLGACYLV